MSERSGSSTTIRVTWDVRDGLTEARQEFYAEHRVKPTDSEVIAWLLEDRKAQRAMDAAAREADRKAWRS